MRSMAILRIAFRALGRNKMRSALTMLGIIIGVAAVIAMVSIGQGAQAMVQDQMQSMGTNVMYVFPSGNRGAGGARLSTSQGGGLTAGDVNAILAEIPIVQAATPIVNANGQLVFGNQNWYAHVRGTNEQYPAIRDWAVADGEFFTEVDIVSASRVIVIGKSVADALFEGLTPIGQTVRLRNLPFRVIGVLEERGQTGNGTGSGRHGFNAIHGDPEETPRSVDPPDQSGYASDRESECDARCRGVDYGTASATPQHRPGAGKRFQNRELD